MVRVISKESGRSLLHRTCCLILEASCKDTKLINTLRKKKSWHHFELRAIMILCLELPLLFLPIKGRIINVIKCIHNLHFVTSSNSCSPSVPKLSISKCLQPQYSSREYWRRRRRWRRCSRACHRGMRVSIIQHRAARQMRARSEWLTLLVLIFHVRKFAGCGRGQSLITG